MSTTIKLENIGFVYRGKGVPNRILASVNYSFEDSTVYALIGHSGSGKSTLLGILSGMLKPTDGAIFYKGTELSNIDKKEYRRSSISLVNQTYNLIPYLTAYENIDFVVNQKNANIKKAEIEGALLNVDLDESKWHRTVDKLSGGEQQRVAIARAIAKESRVIIADEPTGNLDSKTSNIIMDLFIKCARVYNKCVIIVTHSESIAKKADIVLNMNSEDKQIEVVKS